MKRFLFSCTLAAVLFAAAPASAQSLGTFRWRLADFCSVVNVNVIQQGSFYQLVGYEEQCGGNPRLPVYGSAMLQADGTIWLGFTTIFPFGNGLHTQVTLNSSLSGFWRDNANQSGRVHAESRAGAVHRRPAHHADRADRDGGQGRHAGIAAGGACGASEADGGARGEAVRLRSWVLSLGS